MNLVSLLLSSAEERPDAPAIVVGDTTLTFGDLEALAATTAGSLARLGVTPGDRVAIVSPNDVDFVGAYLGTLWAGGVAVPLNPSAPQAALEAEVARVGAKLVVLGPAAHHLSGMPGAHPFEELPPGPAMAAEVELDDGELAVLLYTSGTAGAPRAAMLTHGNLAANISQVQGHTGLRMRSDDVGLAALPFFHVFGLNVALGVGLAAGMRTVLLEQFDAARAVELVREHQVSILAGVPTMFAAMLALPEEQAPRDALVSVRLAVSGAAELPRERAEQFRDRFGVTIFEGYGLTEAAPIVSTTAVESAPHWGSIGPPLPGVEVRLVADDGSDALVGDPGEIWVRGPNVFAGYWDDPETTARVLDGGWLHTGDVAVADDGGYLHLVDRMKDLVIVSGFNVYPAEVEDVLLEHPDIVDAAVTGVPSARTGEAVAAWVVVRSGAALGPDGVRDHAAAQLARYKVPITVELVDALPRNEAGKLLRRELRLTS
ncbi:MAG: long-chain fatty acid--CoA ligase [Actinobacteria bacterium]|nr:long-chain fatty acid--CoA ligase [Actinomycetota bacterium]